MSHLQDMNRVPELNLSNTTVDSYMAYCQDGGCEFNMDDIYNKLRQDDFTNILTITVLLAILSCVGTLGNLCVLLVFGRFAKTTSTYFILSLAGVDLLICSFVIPGLIVKTWYYRFYFDWLCKAWEMFRMYSLPTSALLLVAIALDRYFLICMATSSLMTKRRAKMIILAIGVVGLGLSIPPLLAVGVYEIDDDGAKYYRGICIENYELISIQGLHYYWIFVTILFFGMILIITALYSNVFWTVYKQDRKWKTLRQNLVHPVPLGTFDQKGVSRQDDGSTAKSVQTVSEKNSMPKPSVSFVTDSPGQPKKPSITTADGVSSKIKSPYVMQSGDNNVLFIKVIPKEKLLETEDALSGLAADSSSVKEEEFLRTSETFSTEVVPEANHSLPTPKEISESNSTSRLNQSTNTNQNSVPCDQTDSSKYRRLAHVKTARVVFTVTLVYIVSFLPTFLVTYNVIENEAVFYVYFVNNAANPIIYSFMNKKFRIEVTAIVRQLYVKINTCFKREYTR